MDTSCTQSSSDIPCKWYGRRHDVSMILHIKAAFALQFFKSKVFLLLGCRCLIIGIGNLIYVNYDDCRSIVTLNRNPRERTYGWNTGVDPLLTKPLLVWTGWVGLVSWTRVVRCRRSHQMESTRRWSGFTDMKNILFGCFLQNWHPKSTKGDLWHSDCMAIIMLHIKVTEEEIGEQFTWYATWMCSLSLCFVKREKVKLVIW